MKTSDLSTLRTLLDEAQEQHTLVEALLPQHEWASWYAAFILARQTGALAEEAVFLANAAIKSGLTEPGSVRRRLDFMRRNGPEQEIVKVDGTLVPPNSAVAVDSYEDTFVVRIHSMAGLLNEDLLSRVIEEKFKVKDIRHIKHRTIVL